MKKQIPIINQSGRAAGARPEITHLTSLQSRTRANDPALFGPRNGRRTTLSTRIMTTVWLTAVVLSFSGGAANAAARDKIIAGESVVLAGGTVSTWARVNGGGKVIWVGLTIPLSMVENMPP